MNNKVNGIRQEIEQRVLLAIASRAALSVRALELLISQNQDDLTNDLGIPALSRKGLRNDLSYISTSYPSGSAVTLNLFNKAKTATACIELTYVCAQG